MRCVFEDVEVEIRENKVINDVSYNINEDKLISTKTLTSTITSTIYTYPDGYNLFLKFDESGIQKMFFPMLVSQADQIEKELGSFVETSDVSIKRLGQDNFILIMNDDTNNQGTFSFIHINENKEVIQRNLNYTKLVDYQMVDDKYIVINSYESIDKFNINCISVYYLSGDLFQHVVDVKQRKNISFRFDVEITTKGRKVVRVEKVKGGKAKQFRVCDLQIQIPKDMIPISAFQKEEERSFWYKLRKRREERDQKIKKLKEENEKQQKELDYLKKQIKQKHVKLKKNPKEEKKKSNSKKQKSKLNK